MNLPAELVEQIIDSFITLSSKRKKPFECLNVISLISPFYLEKSRSHRYSDIHIKGKKIVSYFGDTSHIICISKFSSIISVSTSNVPPLNIARHVKCLELGVDAESCTTFNTAMLGKKLDLESIRIGFNNVTASLPPLKLSCINSIKSITIHRESSIDFLEALPQHVRLGIQSFYFFCNGDYEIDYERLINAVNKLKSVRTLSVPACIGADAPEITLPLTQLCIQIEPQHGLDFLRFCLPTLVNININFARRHIDCSDFLQSTPNLERLTILGANYTQASLHETLVLLNNHASLQKVSFNHARCGCHPDKRLDSLDLFYINKKLAKITVEQKVNRETSCIPYKPFNFVLKHPAYWMTYPTKSLNCLIPDLFDGPGYSAQEDFSERIFGENRRIEVLHTFNGESISKELALYVTSERLEKFRLGTLGVKPVRKPRSKRVVVIGDQEDESTKNMRVHRSGIVRPRV